MKKIKIASTFILTLLISGAFAQRNQDTIEVTKPAVEKETALIEKQAVFGYHHNNYKQHAKAKKAKKWFKSEGHVHRKARLTNYKMPFAEDHKVEKTVVNEPTPQKRSRNYKRPYSED